MNQTEEIKQKIDIVDLISSYLTLKKAGKNYKGPCPFHNEKDPSFMVSPDKQIWYCFGCNQGGDIFTFIEKIEGVDFVGALNMLADRAGVILDKKSYEQKGTKNKYLEIIDLANKFFSYILNKSKIGKEAKKYLVEKRKINEETISEFSLGYAPDSQTSLRDFLLKKGYKENDLLKIGLVSKNYQGKCVDKFRGRIVFPIKNVSGKVVGFGGRIFKENQNPKFEPPKYLNSPQSDIYDKSSSLYGLYEAKSDLREKDLVVVVEGYLDVLSSHQVGIKNVVASLGTALTQGQIRVLSRYTKNIAFAFDQDEAGKIALKRAMEMTKYEDINVKAVVIKNAKDPDELIQKNPKEWEGATAKPLSIMEFYYNSLISDYSPEKNIDNKKTFSSKIVPAIANIADSIERAHWIKKMASDLDINEKYIIDAVSKAKTPSSFYKKEEESDGENKVKISPEFIILISVILYPQKAKDLFGKIKEEDLSEEKAKNLYKILFKLYNNKDFSEKIDPKIIKKELNKEEAEYFDLLFFLTEDFFQNLEEKDIFSDIDNLVDKVISQKKEEEKRRIEKEIGSADKTKDKEKIKKLLKELQDLI